MKGKILLFSRDPGGSNTVFPLVPELLRRGYEVKLYGKDNALKRYSLFGFEAQDIMNQLKTIDVDTLKEFIKKENPKFIITGTSADDFTEKYLWKAAMELGIPTFAILDHWSSYGIRFSQYGVADLKAYEMTREHPYLSDRIFVMDEMALEEMIKEGIEPTKIVVTGHPFFEFLQFETKKIKQSDIENFRIQNECGKDHYVITFASEPLVQTYKMREDCDLLGYTELTIFDEIMKAIKNISKDFEKPIKIIIKKHPNESEENYSDLIKKYQSENITITTDKNSNPWLLMLASELVLGMSSMFLVESVVLNCPTLSVLIGLNKENTFILNKKGILKSIVESAVLKERLQDVMLNQKKIQASCTFAEGAIEKIIEYAEGFTCQN